MEGFKNYYKDKQGKKVNIVSKKEAYRLNVVSSKQQVKDNLKSIPIKASKAYVKSIQEAKGVKPSKYRENYRANFRNNYKSELLR
jgi:CTP:phosphocholine cytidylyltransferase-like protein